MPKVYLYNSRKKLLLFRLTLETFRFEDEDDNEVEIWLDLKLFSVFLRKNAMENFVLFFHQKVNWVIFIEEG